MSSSNTTHVLNKNQARKQLWTSYASSDQQKDTIV